MGALTVFQRWLHDPASRGLVRLRPKALDESSAFDGNDYDFLSGVDTHSRALARLRELAREGNTSFLVDEAHPSKTHVQLWEGARGRAIEVDLWKEHRLDDGSGDARPCFLRLPELRTALRPDPDAPDRNVLAVDVEWLLYVIHLHTGRKDPGAPAARNRLRHYGDALGAAADDRLVRPADRVRLAEQVTELQGGEADLARLANECRIRLARTGIRGRSRALEDEPGPRIAAALRRRWEARWHHPLLAFVGPDGSGKTTVIDALRAQPDAAGELRIFKHLFRMTRPYAFVSGRHPAYRPGAENLADEAHGALWFWVAWLRFARELPPGTAAGRVYLDRYFHDLLLTDVRRPGGEPRVPLWRRPWARLFPLPDAVIQLFADEATLRARKQEIEPAKLRRYETLVEEMYERRAPRLRAFVCTSVPVEECVAFLRIVLRRVGDGAPVGAP